MWLDFASPWCWGFILAFWVMFTLTSAQRQSWLWAGANLTLITLVTGARGALYALMGVVFFYLLAQGVKKHDQAQKIHKIRVFTWARLSLPFALLVSLVLFVTHKTEWVLQAEGSLTKSVLMTIGFSYVCLRVIDLISTVERIPELAPSLVNTLNYLLPFHMLTAGPIQTYTDFIEHHPQKNEPTSAQAYVERWLKGGEYIAQGLVKKYCVAALIQGVCLTDFKTTGWALLLEAQLFYVWLYFDFSAYSDLALGVGHLCGLHTPENFNRPLSSRNLTVFWERWHISLSLWVRRHLYTPVQLHLARKTHNTHPVLVSTFAFSVAFVMCGAWHDLSVRFLCWGGLHAAGLSACYAYKHYLIKVWGRKTIRKVYMVNPWVKGIATLLTFEFVALSLLFAFHPTLFH